MHRLSRIVAVTTLLLGAGLLPASAQTFKVQKFNIGGEGGTDYLVAEPGTGQ